MSITSDRGQPLKHSGLKNEYRSGAYSSRRRQWLGALSACFYAGYVLSVSAFLLFCNSLTSFVIYSAIPQLKEQVVMAAISQLFFFLMPVLLTFLQWYLFDHLKRLIRR